MLAIAALAISLLAADPSTAAAVARALQATPPGGRRATAATRALLGAPYLASPLGEGSGPDPDPRFRLDAFDCMTFVEAAVALGSASTLEEAALAMDDIRYSGPPALAARNHEVLSQWIPANVAKGYVEDVTPAVAGPLALRAEKVYTPESWARVRRAGRAIRGLPRARLPLGRFALHLVRSADVPSVAGRLPEGALAFAVRQDAADRATRVTHAGIVVRDPSGRILVRHATSSKGVGRVIEEPLERFLLREQRAYPRWPLEGLAFFAVRDASARVRSLSRNVLPAAAPAAGRPPAPSRQPRAAPAPSRPGRRESRPVLPVRLTSGDPGVK